MKNESEDKANKQVHPEDTIIVSCRRCLLLLVVAYCCSCSCVGKERAAAMSVVMLVVLVLASARRELERLASKVTRREAYFILR
jgi:DMSO reductase anchor subunit